VLLIGGACTAFDVATANLDVDRLRTRVQLIRGDLGRRAQETRLLSAQQRVAAVGVVVAAERIVRFESLNSAAGATA